MGIKLFRLLRPGGKKFFFRLFSGNFKVNVEALPDRPLEKPAGESYDGYMFSVTPCAAGCGHAALSGSTTCAAHAAAPDKEVARIADYIHGRKIIKDLNAAGLRFESVDFSHHHFYGCNFSNCEFSMCLFTENLIRMSFFDFGIFANCDFSKSDLQFLSFAGSTLRNCTFENSELVHINYGGTFISDCTFNFSNLYNSRFIDSTIELTDFIDCNIKKTYFIKSKQEGVSFKSSNTAEAIFELEE